MEQLLSALAETDDPVVKAIYLAGIARLEALDELEHTKTAPLTDCAWCLAKQGIEPRRGDSHGICQACRDEAYEKLQRARIARRPTEALAA